MKEWKKENSPCLAFDYQNRFFEPPASRKWCQHFCDCPKLKKGKNGRKCWFDGAPKFIGRSKMVSPTRWHFINDPKEGRKSDMQRDGERASQAEPTAGTKALQWEWTCLVQREARSLYKEWSKRRVGGEETGKLAQPCPVELYRLGNDLGCSWACDGTLQGLQGDDVTLWLVLAPEVWAEAINTSPPGWDI